MPDTPIMTPSSVEGGWTKGPWEIEAGFLITRALAGGVGAPILQLFDPSGENGFICGEPAELEANAHLIAAAPALFEAGRAVLKAQEDFKAYAQAGVARAALPYTEADLRKQAEDAFSALRAALALALGEGG